MKGFFNQLIILLIYTSLCLSQQCSNNQVYSDNERPSSCKHILANYPAIPSGYYWLQSSDHFTSHKVYCDMENERCGSKGWTRVVLVNMSEILNHVLVISHSFQAPYVPVEVLLLEDVLVLSSLLME